MRAAFAIILLFQLSHATPTRPDSHMAVIMPAADFTLTKHNGEAFRMADLKGKVCLVSFIFTTCNGTCPATTHRMSQVQDHLNSSGIRNEDGAHLISITLDPKRDTQDVLSHYMRLYDADSTRWSFLTGSPPEVEKVIAAWGMWAKPAANEQLDHPSRIFLVDRRGRIREIYDLTFFKAAWVVEDIKTLLSEK